jgi:EAL domain-containing protein (putative c-di-GMP-specific phosphodiesterase class I)
VAVNISAVQFREASFLATVQAALEKTGLHSRWLELEMTESVIMLQDDKRGVAESLESLDQLKALGVDLATTTPAPVTPACHISSAFRSTSSRSISPSCAISPQMLPLPAPSSTDRHLELRTNAEGVETREQLDFLQAHGCDEAQGFLFSKPLSPEECTALLGSQATRQKARITEP